jgi:hypoxanthine phosphoribosyltransferase
MEEINILINKSKLEKRIEEMGKQIAKDYEGKDLVLVGILKGSVIFMAELAKNIKKSVALDFMDVSSYEGTESTGKIKINKDIRDTIEGKDVIIVEDIIDTGRTLTYVKEYLAQKNPNSIKIATMLSKPSRRVLELKVDYIGFAIDDKFVVGYGLDYNEQYRNLPYIGYIEG